MEADAKKLHHYIIKDDPYYDDSDAPPVPIQPGMYQNVGSQTWSTNGKNINDSGLISQKMQLKEKQHVSGVSVFSNPMRSLPNPSDFPNLNAATTSTPVDSMLTQASTSPLLPTFPPLIFTFPTLATAAPIISHVSPPAGLRLGMSPSMNLMTKEMQMLISHFDNKLLLPNIMPLPLPLIMLPEQFKPINPAGPVRNKRSTDYYDNIEEENDDTKSTGTSMHHTTNYNNQQMSKLHKQTIGRKGLLDCMKLLKDS